MTQYSIGLCFGFLVCIIALIIGSVKEGFKITLSLNQAIPQILLLPLAGSLLIYVFSKPEFRDKFVVFLSNTSKVLKDIISLQSREVNESTVKDEFFFLFGIAQAIITFWSILDFLNVGLYYPYTIFMGIGFVLASLIDIRALWILMYCEESKWGRTIYIASLFFCSAFQLFYFQYIAKVLRSFVPKSVIEIWGILFVCMIILCIYCLVEHIHFNEIENGTFTLQRIFVIILLYFLPIAKLIAYLIMKGERNGS